MSGAHMPQGATTEGLACISDPVRRALLARYLDGALSGEMTLMYWLKAVPDIDALRRQLGEAIKICTHVGSAGAVAHSLESLSALIERNYEGCDRIARMLRSGVDSDQPARSVAEGIASCRTLFDWSVEQSSESSVALASLINAPSAIAVAAAGSASTSDAITSRFHASECLTSSVACNWKYDRACADTPRRLSPSFT